MTYGDALWRKLRKLRRSPSAFLRDSRLPPLKALGRAIDERSAKGDPSASREPDEEVPPAVRSVEVILHIGDGKCGSTSIQASLFEAKDRLAADGIVYHPIGPKSGHFGYTTLLGIKSRGDQKRQTRLAARNLEENAAEVASADARFVVFTAESFFRLPPEAVAGLLDEGLGERIGKLHVVGYVRPPADMYLSYMQQRLKASHLIVEPQQYSRDIHRPFAAWAEHPSCASVTVRPFDRALLKDGSVVRDFESVLSQITGCDLGYLADRRENASLSAEQMMVIQQFRRDFVREHDNKYRPESTRLIELFTGLNGVLGMVGTKPALSDPARAEIDAKSRRYVDALLESFPNLGIEGWCLDDVPAPAAEASPWSAHDVSSVLRAHDPRTVDALRALIPRYEAELREGLGDATRAAMRDLGFERRARKLYARYLEEEGCHAAREDVLGLE